MWTWIALFSFGALIVGPFVRRSRLYARIYTPAYLRELRAGLERAKASALGALGQERSAEELLSSGSAFITGPGLALAYTIFDRAAGAGPGGAPGDEAAADRFEHHLSLSYRGGGFALSAAAFLVAAIRRLLDPQADVQVAVAPSGVYHLVFHLYEAQHGAYAQRPLRTLEESDEAPFLLACMQERSAIAASVRPFTPPA